jgi:hypothetical protein
MRWEKEERREAYVLIAKIFVLAPFVGHMLFGMWNSGGRELFRGIVEVLPVVPGGRAGIEALGLFGFGLYSTWLFLFTNDYRKWYQGLLITLASVLVIGSLGLWDGEVVPSIAPSLTNLLSLVLGLVMGLLSETLVLNYDLFGREVKLEGDLTEFSVEHSSLGAAKVDEFEWAEFPIATRGVVWGIDAVLISALILAVVQTLQWVFQLEGGVARNPFVLIVWFAASYGFVRVLRSFVEIDTPVEKARAVVLGPSESGKTLAIFGLFRAARESRGTDLNLNENTAVRNLQEEHDDWEGEGWPFESTETDDFIEYEFEPLVGRRFPKRIGLEMKDHAGEHLDQVKKNLTGEETDWKDNVDGAAVYNGNYAVLPDGGSDDGTDGDEHGPEINEEGVGDERDVGESDELDFGAPAEGKAHDMSGEVWLDDGPMRGEPEVSPEDGGSSGTSRDYGDSADFTGGDSEASAESDAEVNEAERDRDEWPSEGRDQEQPRDDDDTEKELADLTVRVRDADKLVLLIDCRRMAGEDPTGTEDEDNEDPRLTEYAEILDESDAEEAVLVASKADRLLGEWREQTNFDGTLDPADSDAAYSSFRNHVEDQFRGKVGDSVYGRRKGEIQDLMSSANASSIHPVYFETEDSEESSNAATDENGALIPVGFGKVLEEMGK